MMTYAFSASEWDRVWSCVPSAVLPRAGNVTPQSGLGVVMHSYFARLSAGRDVALAEAPEDLRPGLAAIDVDALPVAPGSFAPEVTFAYDPATDTARELGRGLDRDYIALADGELPGTADCVSFSADAVVVLDWKRGWAAHVPVAKEARQLLFLALAAARAYGKTRAVIGIVRILESGRPRVDTAELSAMDLDFIAADVADTIERIKRERQVYIGWKHHKTEIPQVTMGSHCSFCPSFNYCPAQQALLRAVSVDLGPEGDASALMLPTDRQPTDEERKRAYYMWRRAKAVVKRLGDSIVMSAQDAPIPLDNGKFYGQVQTPGTAKYDGQQTHDFLADEYGRDVADEAVEFSTTWAGIERAVKPQVVEAGRKWAEAARGIRKALEEGGAVSRVPSQKMMEFRPEIEADELARQLAPGELVDGF